MGHTVMVMLEAKAGMETELKQALLKVAELSRGEESCLAYQLYQDPENPTQFGLCELWKSKELHQEQFQKAYILEFAAQAERLLAKPFQFFCGQELLA